MEHMLTSGTPALEKAVTTSSVSAAGISETLNQWETSEAADLPQPPSSYAIPNDLLNTYLNRAVYTEPDITHLP